MKLSINWATQATGNIEESTKVLQDAVYNISKTLEAAGFVGISIKIH